MRFQATLMCVYFLLLQSYTWTSQDLSEIEIFRKYCPGVRTCAEQENETLYPDIVDAESCCLTCTCDEHCWERGNCCPDVNHPYKPRTINCDVMKKSSFNYFIVDKCTREDNSIERVICESYNDPRLFEDAVLVSNINNTLVYRNRYCAECNGEYDYVPWTIAASDQNSYERCTNGKNTLRSNVSRLQDCDLISIRPNDEIHMNTLCYAESITISADCPASTDPTLQWYRERCLKYRLPVYFNNLVNNSSRIYRNVFCFLCEVYRRGLSLDDVHVCDGQSIIGQFFSTRFMTIVPYTKIFSLTDPSDKSNLPECEEDQLFDEYLKQCLNYSCGFGYVTQHGGCTRNIMETFNVPFGFQFEFSPIPNEMNVSDTSVVNTFIGAAKRTITSIAPCEFANEKAWTMELDDNVTRSFLWQTEIYTTFDCQDPLIKDISDYVRSNKIVISVDETVVSIKPTMFLSDIPTGTRVSPIEIKPNELDFVHKAVKVSAVTFCTTITITRNLMEDLEKDISHYQGTNDNMIQQLREGVTYEGDLYKICYESYRDIRSQLKYPRPLVTSSSVTGYLSVALQLVSVIFAGLTIASTTIFARSQISTKYILHVQLVCINLILAQLMFTFGIGANVSGVPCTLIGVLIHYLWLTHAAAMNAFVLGVVITLRRRTPTSSLSYTSILLRVAYIYGTPLVFVALNVAVSNVRSNHTDPGYGEGPEGLCYISTAFSRTVFFVVPIFIVVGLNMCAYVYFIWFMIKHKTDSDMLNSQRMYLQAYARLSCISGFTWLFGLLSEFVGTEVFEYLFILTNCGQGLLLFFAFGRVKDICTGLKARIFTTITTSSNTQTVRS